VLPSGRKEQLRVYAAMEADIRKLRGSGQSANAIASTLQSTPDKYAVRKSGDELYVSTRGVAAYKTVMDLFKAQTSSPNATTAVLSAIATHRTALLSDGPLDAAIEVPRPAPGAKAAAPARLLPALKPEMAQKLLISKPNALYSGIMRASHMEGTVHIQISVGPDGAVTDTKVLTSPNDMLSTSALNAVRNYKYSPYLINGKATAFQTTVDVTFSMH
jgi:TonB family protein